MSNNYFIHQTDGTLLFALEPGSLNGPGSQQYDSDLVLRGQGSRVWGEGVNENLYKLLESFSCAAKELNDYNPATLANDYDPTTDPTLPKDAHDLGLGFGINQPVIGQLWYDSTSAVVNVYTATGWMPVGSSINTTQPTSPSIGDLWYDEYEYQLKVYAVKGDFLLTSVQAGEWWLSSGTNANASIPAADIQDFVAGDKWIHDDGQPTGPDTYTVQNAYVFESPTITGQVRLTTIEAILPAGLAGTGSGKIVGWGSVAKNYIALDGSSRMSGDLNMGFNQIHNMAVPITDTQGANKKYVDDTSVSSILPATKTGSLTLSGNLHMDNSDISVDFGQTIAWGSASNINPNGRITYYDTHVSASGSLMYMNVGPGVDSEFRIDYIDGTENATNILRAAGDQFTYKNNTIWHSGNDGSGSGLDADTLDGYSATAWNDFSGSTVPVRHPSGFLYTNYLNMSADTTDGSLTRVAIETGNDGYLRWTTPEHLGKATGTPTGTILATPYTHIAPRGYIVANGAAISRTAYSDLFNHISTFYGAGNGSTTFNLPDYRGEFLRGYDNGRGVDPGHAFGQVQADSLRAHTHTGGSSSHTDFLEAGPHPINILNSGSPATGSTGGTETRPRNISVQYWIKY